LLLVCLASSAAWGTSLVLGRRLAAPLDFGLELPDGKRLLGSHKTWRGVAAGILACALAAPLVGLEVTTGAGFGAADQLPEALVPLVLFAEPLGIGIVEIAVVALAFAGLDLLATPLRRRT
jgi:CDP-2,3-bis-(O-geranylgeranyl)-sn-glycerol synthase